MSDFTHAKVISCISSERQNQTDKSMLLREPYLYFWPFKTCQCRKFNL